MQRFVSLVGLCLAIFMIMTGMGMAAVALPDKYLKLAGSMRMSGWIAASFAVAYVSCQYPVGRWADRYGFRPVLVLGCLVVALAAAVLFFARSPEAIYLGRFVQGLGEAPLWATAPALLGQLYPEQRGRAMGLYNASFHAGLMSGPLVGVWVMTLLGGEPFVCFGGVAVAAAALVMCTVPKATQQPRRVSAGARLDLSMVKNLWPLLCGVPVFGAAYGLLVSCLPVHVAATPGVGPSGLGWFLFTAYAGVAVAQLGVGRLSDVYGRSAFIVAGLITMAGALVCFVWLGPDCVVASAAVLGLGLGSFAIASMALVSESIPQQHKGAALGAYYLVWGLGYFAGPLAVNALTLRWGCPAIALCAIVAAVYALRRRPNLDR